MSNLLENVAWIEAIDAPLSDMLSLISPVSLIGPDEEFESTLLHGFDTFFRGYQSLDLGDFFEHFNNMAKVSAV